MITAFIPFLPDCLPSGSFSRIIKSENKGRAYIVNTAIDRKKDYRFWIVLVCAAVFAVLTALDLRMIRPPRGGSVADFVVIYAATALPFLILFGAALLLRVRGKRLAFVGVFFLLSYAVRILFADLQSNDYIWFLSVWMKEYRALPLKECFIRQVGNYPPLYNYFLIAFSRLPIRDLYLIKTLSFYGEVLAAVFAAKLVALVRKDSFSFPVLALFLFFPIFLSNSSKWAQCDTLYAGCALAGIYFALKRKSVLCYICIGLGLAFKLQMLFILPVGLILLLSADKDGKKFILWRYIWVAPLAFIAVSIVPVFFGGSFFKVFSVYFNQATEGNAQHGLNGHCANILLPFYAVPKGSIAYYILFALFVTITAAILLFLIIHTLRVSKRQLSPVQVVLLSVLLPLVSVFFMPKMYDRFYYIAELFLAVLVCVSRNKNTFTAFAALETGQWLIYTRSLAKIKGAYYASPLFVAFALAFVFLLYFAQFPHPKFSPLAERFRSYDMRFSAPQQAEISDSDISVQS